MKGWLVGAAAVFVAGAVAFGGLWLHAASVESGEANRQEVGEYVIRGDVAAGDILVMPWATSLGAVLYSLELDSELLREEFRDVYTAEGPVSVVMQLHSGGLKAISEQGETAWEMGPETENSADAEITQYDSYWPQAAGSEGTIVTLGCHGRPLLDIDSCDMFAVDAEGNAKWRADVPEGYRLTSDFRSQWPVDPIAPMGYHVDYPMPLPDLAVTRVTDEDAGTEQTRLFDPELGEVETVEGPPWFSFHGLGHTGFYEPVPGENYADTDLELCELRISSQSQLEPAAVTHACQYFARAIPEGDYVSFDRRWLEEQGVDTAHETAVLHAPSAQWVPSASPDALPDQVVGSAAGLAERVGEVWHLSGVDGSGDIFHYELPEDYELAVLSADTVILVEQIESWNPLVSHSTYEFVLLDPATGEQCAVTRATDLNSSALAGCRALVRDDDGIAYLVGRR